MTTSIILSRSVCEYTAITHEIWSTCLSPILGTGSSAAALSESAIIMYERTRQTRLQWYYLWGQGDLVSRLILGIIRATILTLQVLYNHSITPRWTQGEPSLTEAGHGNSDLWHCLAKRCPEPDRVSRFLKDIYAYTYT